MHKIIHDYYQLRMFYDILPELKPEEAYFLSMSARNKYLTPVERVALDLGRTEMFARKLVKQSNWETFLRVMKTFEVAEGGYTSRSHIELPSKCLVCYANINPVSGMKALKEFMTKTTEMLFSMNDGTQMKKLSSLDTELMNCYQRAKGTRKWIDVDFDIPEEGEHILKQFLDRMIDNDIEYYVIQTKSGYHVLLLKEDIKFNYTEMVTESHNEAISRFGSDHVEVQINKNDMVPVPGTYQADFPVKFWERN